MYIHTLVNIFDVIFQAFKGPYRCRLIKYKQLFNATLKRKNKHLQRDTLIDNIKL